MCHQMERVENCCLYKKKFIENLDYTHFIDRENWVSKKLNNQDFQVIKEMHWNKKWGLWVPFLLSSHSHGLKVHTCTYMCTHSCAQPATLYSSNSGGCFTDCSLGTQEAPSRPYQLHCYVADTTLFPLGWQGGGARRETLCQKSLGLQEAELGLPNYPELNHNCKPYPIKRHLPSHPLKPHQPQAFNNCELGRQSGLMVLPSNGNLAPLHSQGSELSCGSPFNCLIIMLSSSMDSVTNSWHSAQSNSAFSV